MNLQHKIRLCASATLTLFIGACGDSTVISPAGSNLADDTTAGQTTNTQERLQVSGMAVKGQIANGLVSLYGVAGGQRQLLGTTISGADGSYDLDIPSNYAGPIEVEVSALADGSSTMLCDAAGGCGDAAFGTHINLQEGFSLSAVLRNVLPGQPVNLHVTPITNMAATWAESLGYDAESIANANAQVADLFDLPGNFTSIEPVDVTDSDAVEQQPGIGLRYGVLAGAFADFDTNQTDLNTHINGIADSFSGLNGQLFELNSADGSVTLDDLLESAQDLANHIGSSVISTDIASVRETIGATGQPDNDGSTDTTDASGGDSGNNITLNEILQASLVDMNDLADILSEVNIQSYLQSQADQFEWILTPDLPQAVGIAIGGVVQTAFLALAHDTYEQVAQLHGLTVIDFSLNLGGATATTNNTLKSTYDIPNRILRIFTEEGVPHNGQTVDLSIEIAPVRNGLLSGDLKYLLKQGSRVANSSFVVEFNRDSDITFVFDEEDSLVDIRNLFLGALQGQVPALPDYCPADAEGDLLKTLDCLAGDFLQGLNMHGTLQFAMTVTNASDPSQQFDIDFSGYGDIDLTDPEAPTVSHLEILDGHVFFPNGDRLFALEGSKALALALGNTDNSMFARFGVDSPRIPETHLTVRTQFRDLAEYLALFDGSSVNFNFSEKLTIANVIDKPLTTLGEVVTAFSEEGAIDGFARYLLTETTPKDYLDAVEVEMEIPERMDRYSFGFGDNVVNVVNADGLDYRFTYADEVITVVVNAFGADLVKFDIQRDGTVQAELISDQIQLELSDIPVEDLKSIFARLAPLAGIEAVIDGAADNADDTGSTFLGSLFSALSP